MICDCVKMIVHRNEMLEVNGYSEQIYCWSLRTEIALTLG